MLCLFRFVYKSSKSKAEEVLEVEFEISEVRTRKYYKLTEKGKQEAVLKIEELKTFIQN